MKPILSLNKVTKWFPVSSSIIFRTKKYVRAVDNVSFDIFPGEKLGIIGESGSGKTTLGKIIAGIIEPDSGEIILDGYRYSDLYKKNRKFIYKHVQMIFQDPYSALNPKKTVRKILERPFKIIGKSVDVNEIKEVLRMVDLVPPESFLEKYPSQLSSGQRQRVVIARALAMNPRILVADEPVSMLDATIKVQILKLLEDLRKSLGLTYILITHEISHASVFCDRVVVMYLGKVMEIGSAKDIFETPMHPYTRFLLSSVLLPDPEEAMYTKPIDVKISEPPSLIDPPLGCRFSTRCPLATEKCKISQPILIPYRSSHVVACPITTGRENEGWT